MVIEALTTTQVAQRLGCTTANVRFLTGAGKLRSIATPYGRLFDPVEVELYRERRAARRLAKAS